MVDEYEAVYQRMAADASLKPSARRRADERVPIVAFAATSAHDDRAAIVDGTSDSSTRPAVTARS
jgi:hypothetical protein